MQQTAMETPLYTGRRRSKKITKLMAISFAVLALVVQLVSGVAFPGQSNTAMALSTTDPDNIVKGGLRDKEHALAVYDGNAEIRAIYKEFGVTREDIANSKMGSFSTNDFNGQINVIGRENHGVPTRHPVKVDGTNTTVYTGEFLDGYNQKDYKFDALIGTRASDGKWFALMLYCGNIAYVEKPEPQPEPAAVCKVLLYEKLNRTHVRVAANAEVSGGAEIQNYKFVILKDGKEVNTRTVETSASSAYIEYDTAKSGGAGTYTAKAGVNTTVGYKTSPDCEKTFTIAPEPVKNIKVCELATNKIVTIDEKDFDDSKYSKDLDKCNVVVPVEKEVEVCVLATKEIKTIKESEFDATKHSKDSADCDVVVVPVEENIQVCVLDTKEITTIKESEFDDSKHSMNPEDCEEVPVVKNIEVCELDSKQIVIIKESEFDSSRYSQDIKDCQEEPVTPVTPTTQEPTPPEPQPTTPPELPRTGVADVASGLLGLGSMIAAAGYYFSSRRNLLTTLLDH